MKQLTSCQAKALDVFKDFILDPTKKEMVLSGSPGRGKSFLVAVMIEEAKKLHNVLSILSDDLGELSLLTTATTGKATRVLEDQIQHPSSTVHSALGLRPVYNPKTKTQHLKKTNDFKVHPETLLVIDEASGIGKYFLSLIREANPNCKTLFVGDKRQIPEVGETSCVVFDDPEVFFELKEPVRFDKDSGIAKLGKQLEDTIDTGVFQPIKGNGKDIQYIDGNEFELLIPKYFDPRDPNKAKIVAWSNRAVREYNAYVRSLFIHQPQTVKGESLVCSSPVLAANQKVILGTEEEVVVSDIEDHTMYVEGILCEIVTLRRKLGGTVTVNKPVNFQDVKNRADLFKKEGNWYQFYNFPNKFADLRPPYSSTAHKAQGSTYETVFIDLDDIGKCHCWSTVARMLNVAVTRAKSQVFLYGSLPNRYRNFTYGNDS